MAMTVRNKFTMEGVREMTGRLTNLKPTLQTLRSTLRPPPKIAEDFYLSPAWRHLVASIKRERGNWCQRCGSTKRIIADHIRERKDSGAALDPANIELLCQACHNAKTAKERTARAYGQRR